MFNKLLNREDTVSFVRQLFNNNIYRCKNANIEDIIGLFYDAIFKYSVIIDNDDAYEDYLVNLDLLFSKIDNINEIDTGINKLLSKIIIKKNNSKDKEEFIDFVYDKYVVNGYFIHAYSNKYREYINTNGFMIDVYLNLYNKFIKVQQILSKYNNFIIDKDFNKRIVYFTDSMKTAYYYSLRSPYYFYNMICGDELVKNKDCYTNKDYKECINNIKKICSKYNINSNDSKFIIDTFNEEWNLINTDSNISSFIVVKRDCIEHSKFDLDNFKEKYLSEDYYVILDRLIDNNYSNLVCDKNLSRDNIQLVDINNDLEYKEKEKETEIMYDSGDFANSYGKVSLLILLGSILITIGVIIAIILII